MDFTHFQVLNLIFYQSAERKHLDESTSWLDLSREQRSWRDFVKWIAKSELPTSFIHREEERCFSFLHWILPLLKQQKEGPVKHLDEEGEFYAV